MADTTRNYPTACPKCQQDRGFPFHVRTVGGKPGYIEVKLRCRECRHEWRQEISNTH
jgi:hypothetical protein